MLNWKLWVIMDPAKSAASGVSCSSIQRILKRYPYTRQRVREMNEDYFRCRVGFCQTLIVQLNNTHCIAQSVFLYKLLVS
jgi:hypothetical protein